MAKDFTEEVDSELMVLESIYEDKISIKRENEEIVVEITIYPATADSLNSQYVCLRISFLLKNSYPSTNPEIAFTMSRGLSDANLNELFSRMKDFTSEHSNECILFDLMEIAKDSLTSNNVPSCPCSICLLGFHENDDFLKTDCYHYFHSFCMNQYFSYHLHEDCEEEERKVKVVDRKENAIASCPVCRNSINLNIASIEKAPPPLDDFNYEIDEDVKNCHVQQFKAQYELQQQNGGLIDLEYEKNKFLLSNIQQTYLNQVASKQNEAKSALPKDDVGKTANGIKSMSVSNTSTATSSNHDFERKKHSYPMSRKPHRPNSAPFQGRVNYFPRNKNFQTYKNTERQQKPHYRQKEHPNAGQKRYPSSKRQNYCEQSSSSRDPSQKQLTQHNYLKNSKNIRVNTVSSVREVE